MLTVTCTHNLTSGRHAHTPTAAGTPLAAVHRLKRHLLAILRRLLHLHRHLAVDVVEDEESASPAVKEALALKKKTDGGGAPGAFKEAGKDAGPSTPRSREAANTFAHKLLEIWIGRLRTQ